MGQVADIHGIRRGLVLQLFGDFIEGKASLESVLHKRQCGLRVWMSVWIA